MAAPRLKARRGAACAGGWRRGAGQGGRCRAGRVGRCVALVPAAPLGQRNDAVLSALQNHSWHPAATAVAAPQVFHLIPSPYQAHAELLRILKPGGAHIFTAPFTAVSVRGGAGEELELGVQAGSPPPRWSGALLRTARLVLFTRCKTLG